MRRYTTPTLRISVTGADLSGCEAYVTVAQGGKSVTIRLDTLDDWEATDVGATCTVTLTQEQTASFAEGRDAEVQVNAIDGNGYRFATGIGRCRFDRNLLDTRIEHD